MTFPVFMVGAGSAAVMAALIRPLASATFLALVVSACAFAVSAAVAILDGPDRLRAFLRLRDGDVDGH